MKSTKRKKVPRMKCRLKCTKYNYGDHTANKKCISLYVILYIFFENCRLFCSEIVTFVKNECHISCPFFVLEKHPIWTCSPFWDTLGICKDKSIAKSAFHYVTSLHFHKTFFFSWISLDTKIFKTMQAHTLKMCNLRPTSSLLSHSF